MPGKGLVTSFALQQAADSFACLIVSSWTIEVLQTECEILIPTYSPIESWPCMPCLLLSGSAGPKLPRPLAFRERDAPQAADASWNAQESTVSARHTGALQGSGSPLCERWQLHTLNGAAPALPGYFYSSPQSINTLLYPNPSFWSVKSPSM